jgi:hypothetical protein
MDFDWIDKDRVAGCEGPRSESDLEYLKSQKIRALVRLAPEIQMKKQLVEANGMEDCFEPVRDREAPSYQLFAGLLIALRNRAYLSGRLVTTKLHNFLFHHGAPLEIMSVVPDRRVESLTKQA